MKELMNMNLALEVATLRFIADRLGMATVTKPIPEIHLNATHEDTMTYNSEENSINVGQFVDPYTAQNTLRIVLAFSVLGYDVMNNANGCAVACLLTVIKQCNMQSVAAVWHLCFSPKKLAKRLIPTVGSSILKEKQMEAFR